MSGPFEPYPVSPGWIDAAANKVERAAEPVRDVAHLAGTAVAVAKSETVDGLLGWMDEIDQPLLALGDSLHQQASYAAAVVSTWALAVLTFNEQVDELNREYAEAQASGFGVPEPMMRAGQTPEARATMFDRYDDAVAGAAAAKLSELRIRKHRLDDQLDETADDLASRLNRCPTASDWSYFDALGVLPPGAQPYVPTPPPPPEEDHDNWFETVFKTVVFDPGQCEDGFSFGCATEVVGILPVGKIVKGGKLAAKGIKAADNARDTEKTIDRAEDAVDDAGDLAKGDTPRIHVEEGKQGKHIPGHPNYQDGKSYLDEGVDPEDLAQYAGTGQQRGNVPVGEPGSKEVVDAGKVIGVYKNEIEGVAQETTNYMIHYSKTGIHIVPARPNP